MTRTGPVVGITQRVVEVEDYLEVRDCLDQAWTNLLGSLQIRAVPIPNRQADIADYCAELGLEGFILTGGNDLSLDVYEPGSVRRGVSADRDATEAALLDHAVTQHLPVLGVCRGLQFLQAYFGGDLMSLGDGKVDHVATTHVVEFVDGSATADRLEVNSFHDFGIAAGTLAEPLRPIAVCPDDGTIEGARHAELPIVGIMWHPERTSPDPWYQEQLIRELFPAGDGVAG